ncbi:MAG: ATP-binding protein [Phycisphaerales bacterium JB059]
MRVHTRLVLINLIGVLFILSGSAGLVAQTRRFRSDWQTLQQEVEVRSNSLERVRGAIGYGGMIHAVKNYVLRRDPAYADLFRLRVENARAGIRAYRESGGLHSMESADLDRVSELIDRYEQAMRRAIESDLEASALDEIIRIDDAPYLEALSRLLRGVEHRRDQIASHVDSDLAQASVWGAWMGVLGAGVVLGVGGVLAYRVGRRLERSVEEKERANRDRACFLANMSHEIRTPLNAMLGFAELARDSSASQTECDRYLEWAHSAGLHLLELVNNVLDLTKLEAGRMELSSEPTDVAQVLAAVESIVGVRARTKGISLRCEIGQGVPEGVVVDPTPVRQILVNLAGNAVKFTDEGGVEIRADFQPRGPLEGLLRFTIRDTGIGMAPEVLERVFAPFTQADVTTTRRYGGTGLGLHISRRLCDLLGGQIEVRSTPGEGSEFRLAIPVVRASTPTEARRLPDRSAQTDQRPLEGVRVLLVEDGPDNRVLLERFLRVAGADVEAVEDGRGAIERIGAGGAYDIVLMDMQMPNVDGYEATRRVREMGFRGPIVALTALALHGDREACLSAGCDDYATEPIGRGKLIDVCVSHTTARRAA